MNKFIIKNEVKNKKFNKPVIFVVMYYSCDQNEPSKPCKKLITASSTNDLLKKAMTHFDIREYDSDMDITFEKDKDGSYSDYALNMDDNTFLLLTAVTK